MMGMEKMIANMLGVTPESMAQTIGEFQALLTGLNTRLENIERQQTLILNLITEKFDGGRDDHSDDNIPALICIGDASRP